MQTVFTVIALINLIISCGFAWFDKWDRASYHLLFAMFMMTDYTH